MRQKKCISLRDVDIDVVEKRKLKKRFFLRIQTTSASVADENETMEWHNDEQKSACRRKQNEMHDREGEEKKIEKTKNSNGEGTTSKRTRNEMRIKSKKRE